MFNKSFLKEFSSGQNLIDAVRQSGGNEIYEKKANSPAAYLTDKEIQELINNELLPNQTDYVKAQKVLNKKILNLPSPYDIRKKRESL